MPKNRPEIVTVPEASISLSEEAATPTRRAAAYQQAIGVLYAVAYTLKMSARPITKWRAFLNMLFRHWRASGGRTGKTALIMPTKSAFHWISVIRLPDFVTRKDFVWAVETATKKKKLDCSSAEFLTIEEGLCVQMMHLGPFDQEPASVALMDAYLAEHGYENDLSETRLHHEIYLSDARKVAPEKWKTVIRHPIKKR